MSILAITIRKKHPIRFDSINISADPDKFICSYHRIDSKSAEPPFP